MALKKLGTGANKLEIMKGSFRIDPGNEMKLTLKLG